jgi:Mitotic checkpoint regulator, MAD2B-interacting
VHSTPGQDFDHLPYDNKIDTNIYGPAVAPYPPPAPLPSASTDGDDLLADAEALQRLVGRTGMRKQREELNFVDIHNDDIKPTPREWMVTALTDESERGDPGPRCTIKGEKKKKHQITYLAALAKERENVLKQQWANNAQTRRATQSKYGF